jgi:hypothetical protein
MFQKIVGKIKLKKMTPKEKADQLIARMDAQIIERHGNEAVVCALICIDEMLDIANGLYFNGGSAVHQYLIEVKKEILAA